ncbi:hypothetical protein GCM10023310_46820 [Paenibacillus vulneris]|uniref:Uncharacterized protein n=1 Tax=Paenibacillus vulneris TaxID=1133364 RepID=A0ABW3UDF6_9BACL|nr:hypothetical protein [Paenibacillus sp. 32352]
MSYDNIYWLIISAAFVFPLLIGILIMLKTKRMLVSFLISLAVNLAITVPSCMWWSSLFEGFSRMFGLFGFGVAFVNTEVLVLFALFIMRKKAPNPETVQ